MSGLLRDRYLPFTDGGAWDLATGQIVPLDTAAGAPDTGPPIPSLVEVLEHGHEGAPRWLVAQVGRERCGRAIRRAAEDATACGYVPIAVEVFDRLRGMLGIALQDRALLLIAGAHIAGIDAAAALIQAAAASPRPHVLLTMRPAGPGRGDAQ